MGASAMLLFMGVHFAKRWAAKFDIAQAFAALQG
jgi:hypothetical protein